MNLIVIGMIAIVGIIICSGEGNDINIPENTIMVITNKSNISDNTKFGKLNVPQSSKLIIDVKTEYNY